MPSTAALVFIFNQTWPVPIVAPRQLVGEGTKVIGGPPVMALSGPTKDLLVGPGSRTLTGPPARELQGQT